MSDSSSKRRESDAEKPIFPKVLGEANGNH